MPLSDEQLKIKFQKLTKNQILKINAFAGTGKNIPITTKVSHKYIYRVKF